MNETETKNYFLKQFVLLVRRWLKKMASSINHNIVIKDVYAEVETSSGYFLLLTVANLIALSGLLMNNLAVIIGSMLISPLMGPILSFGFAFVTGDKSIWRKSVRKVATSIALIIVVAAAASYVSPLKDITPEIAARTRPNLYDLLIAFFAGIAGAGAICTKKRYITIVPGVAIATAVIPPLSVAGFGLGTWEPRVLYGGFFLFFTNFVAIIISTVVVFFIYGFRPSMMSDVGISNLKRRFAFLGAVLLFISIPLIYTLDKSISEVRLRNSIQSALKKSLDKEKRSRLSTLAFTAKKDEIEVSAGVNTIEYYDDTEVSSIENKVSESLGRKVSLYLEQVKVQPGGLKKLPAKIPAPSIAPVKQPPDIIKSSRESVVSVIRQTASKIEGIISPSTVADFYVGFGDKSVSVSLIMKIRRDAPLSEEEVLWLRRMFARELGLPVDLKVENIPFVPLLVFERGETALSEEMKKAMSEIKAAYAEDPGLRIKMEAVPEDRLGTKKAKEFAQARIDEALSVLVEEFGIPLDKIEAHVAGKAMRVPTLRISVDAGQMDK